MMKKIIPLAAMTLAALISGQAFAGNFAGPGATTLSPAPGHAQPCAALSNDVAIQLSKGVYAGYTCDINGFNAATCHETGTNKSQTVACTYTLLGTEGCFIGTDDPACYGASDDQCPAWDPTPDAEQATQVTFIGRLAYQGASGGGTVGPVNLRGDTCDGATAEGLTN